MPYDPILSAIRFGTGLSPTMAPAPDAVTLLDDLAGPDRMDQQIAITGFDATQPSLAALQMANKVRREATDAMAEESSNESFRAIRRAAAAVLRQNHLNVIARAVGSRTGLRERLVAFWADHFTVKAKAYIQRHLVTPYTEDAIRPHVTGRFGDMLKAVVQHPMMLTYLEQFRSTGPNSPVGVQLGRGLNENLARELLELHLLGVNGAYSQQDVREFAELLTGLVYQSQRGFFYNPRMAEPGAEEVLGIRFDAAADLSTVLDALDTLALLPQTAQHLAHKMAVHFISAVPDPALVAAMRDSYLATGGNLMAMTASMINHPAAWQPAMEKVRLPTEFLAAAMRALGVTAGQVQALSPRDYRNMILNPSQVMGQSWETPIGPDGWSEDPADWIIPQAMAARISWALRVPLQLVDPLPDPRDFVRTALGDRAPGPVIFAAAAAETTRDGVGIVLASAAFQRR